MSNRIHGKLWLYGLLVLPLCSALFALMSHGFVFKAGVAASCIMIILISFAIHPHRSKDVFIIVAAFLLSIAGDWYLSNRQSDTGRFIIGIAFFFIAHIAYFSYAMLHGKIRWRFTLFLLAGYTLFFWLWLYPSINNTLLMLSSFLYTLISCFSLGAASGMQSGQAVRLTYMLGIGLILFSDTIIAFKEFTSYRELNFLILPTYYLAQISITLSVVFKRGLYS